MKKREFTKGEVKELFEEAARIEKQPNAETGYSAETVQHAATEAGISRGQLTKAMHRLELRRASRLGLVLVAAVSAAAIGALLLFPSALIGKGEESVLLHNDNRKRAHTVEVLVPVPDAAAQVDCDQSPDQRVAAGDYCVARQVRLEPRARLRVHIPHQPSSCPQIWVRVVDDNDLQSSALFTLPAGVEFDKHGHIDQKGLGRPNMHPGPAESWIDAPACPSAIVGGAS